MDNFNMLLKTNRELVKVNKKLASFKYSFARGIVFGIGSAIGASIIAAIVIGLLNNFLDLIKK